MPFELLTMCTSREDVSVFMTGGRTDTVGASGSALRTYVHRASRETAVRTSEFQHNAVTNLTRICGVLLDMLDSSNSSVSLYKRTAALGVCVELQVLGSFHYRNWSGLEFYRALISLQRRRLRRAR